jgi:hypothetical protein
VPSLSITYIAPVISLVQFLRPCNPLLAPVNLQASGKEHGDWDDLSKKSMVILMPSRVRKETKYQVSGEEHADLDA